MSADLGTTVTAQEFMKAVLKQFYKKSWFVDVTNRDFSTPGDESPSSTKSIKSKNQKFTITSILSSGWNTYSGSDLSFTNAKETISTLTIDTFKAVSETITSLGAFKSAVADPQSSLIMSQAEKLKVILQKAAIAMYVDAGAGNMIGTNYGTGTVTVTTGTGAVTGSGTTFTAAMVGQSFKAAGHAKWHRVKTYTSGTAIVIEDDSDDEASAYTGGTINAGAAYVIQATALLAVTKTNIAATLALCAQSLDDASYGDNDEMVVPTDGRFIILPAIARSPLVTAAEFNRDIEMTYSTTVKEGVVGRAYGMDIILAKTGWFAGDNTAGFKCVFGHKNFITAGYGFIDPISIILSKDNQTNFGDKIKGLFGFGLKCADTRRMCGGYLFATFA